jgi:hypothetical protein
MLRELAPSPRVGGLQNPQAGLQQEFAAVSLVRGIVGLSQVVTNV